MSIVLLTGNPKRAVIIQVQTQSAVAIYMMGVVIVCIKTQLGIISHIAKGERKYIVAIVSTKRKEVLKD
jgi:hypothetical protein